MVANLTFKEMADEIARLRRRNVELQKENKRLLEALQRAAVMIKRTVYRLLQ